MSLQKYFTKLMLTDEDKKHQLQHTINGTYSSWIRAHRYYKHFDPRKHSIRYGSKAKPALPPINENDKRRKTKGVLVCNICMERFVTVFLAPCGHAQICLPCLHDIRNRCTTDNILCPICRCQVETVHRLYI